MSTIGDISNMKNTPGIPVGTPNCGDTSRSCSVTANWFVFRIVVLRYVYSVPTTFRKYWCIWNLKDVFLMPSRGFTNPTLLPNAKLLMVWEKSLRQMLDTKYVLHRGNRAGRVCASRCDGRMLQEQNECCPELCWLGHILRYDNLRALALWGGQ